MSFRVVNPPRLDCAVMHHPSQAPSGLYPVISGRTRPDALVAGAYQTSVPVGTSSNPLFTAGLSKQYAGWVTVRSGSN
jgi:hypothetical protein